jgi:hypothetical protein
MSKVIWILPRLLYTYKFVYYLLFLTSFTLLTVPVAPHNFTSSAVPCIVPYLKRGKHGPGGDFDNDSDRVTGQGHDYHPNDVNLYEDYLAQRAAFYKLHPTYPKLQGNEHVDDEMKAKRDDWERWYITFKGKYPGRGANLWVCGCAKVADNSECESEEE